MHLKGEGFHAREGQAEERTEAQRQELGRGNFGQLIQPEKSNVRREMRETGIIAQI